MLGDNFELLKMGSPGAYRVDRRKSVPNVEVNVSIRDRAHSLAMPDRKDWRGLEPVAKKKCQLPDPADDSEAILSTMPWR